MWSSADHRYVSNKVYILFSLLFLSTLNNISCNELFLLAESSDRSDNPYLIEILKNSTLEECISLIKGIGGRDDIYIADILLFLAAPHKERYKYEHLLRLILHYLSDQSLENEQIYNRIEVNRVAIDYFIQNLSKFKSFQLKSILIDFLTFEKPQGYESILLTELILLTNLLMQDKSINPDLNAELISIFNAINPLNNYAFIEPLLMVIKFSSEQSMINQARIVINSYYYKK